MPKPHKDGEALSRAAEGVRIAPAKPGGAPARAPHHPHARVSPQGKSFPKNSLPSTSSADVRREDREVVAVSETLSFSLNRRDEHDDDVVLCDNAGAPSTDRRKKKPTAPVKAPLPLQPSFLQHQVQAPGTKMDSTGHAPADSALTSPSATRAPPSVNPKRQSTLSYLGGTPATSAVFISELPVTTSPQRHQRHRLGVGDSPSDTKRSGGMFFGELPSPRLLSHSSALATSNGLEKTSLSSHDGGRSFTAHSIDSNAISVDNSIMRVSLAQRALIGKGSFGVVYQAMDRDNNHLIAVKEITFDKGKSTPQVESVRRELALLKKLDHPNIVKCLGEECDAYCLRIFMEFVSGGNISTVLRTFGPFREKQASIFAKQMLDGLQYLHAKHIIHRDLKGDNLLIDTMGVLKLADFGTARDIAVKRSNSMVGTAYFMAPEVVKGESYGTEADIWSAGCCVVEMLTGKPPLHHFQNQYTIMLHIAEGKCDDEIIPAFVTDAAKAFLRKCLARDPSSRASAAELLQDPWIINPPDVPVSEDGGVRIAIGDKIPVASGYSKRPLSADEPQPTKSIPAAAPRIPSARGERAPRDPKENLRFAPPLCSSLGNDAREPVESAATVNGAAGSRSSSICSSLSHCSYGPQYGLCTPVFLHSDLDFVNGVSSSVNPARHHQNSSAAPRSSDGAADTGTSATSDVSGKPLVAPWKSPTAYSKGSDEQHYNRSKTSQSSVFPPGTASLTAAGVGDSCATDHGTLSQQPAMRYRSNSLSVTTPSPGSSSLTLQANTTGAQAGAPAKAAPVVKAHKSKGRRSSTQVAGGEAAARTAQETRLPPIEYLGKSAAGSPKPPSHASALGITPTEIPAAPLGQAPPWSWKTPSPESTSQSTTMAFHSMKLSPNSEVASTTFSTSPTAAKIPPGSRTSATVIPSSPPLKPIHTKVGNQGEPTALGDAPRTGTETKPGGSRVPAGGKAAQRTNR